MIDTLNPTLRENTRQEWKELRARDEFLRTCLRKDTPDVLAKARDVRCRIAWLAEQTANYDHVARLMNCRPCKGRGWYKSGNPCRSCNAEGREGDYDDYEG